MRNRLVISLLCLCLPMACGAMVPALGQDAANPAVQKAPSQPRIALVIGNQDYRHVERLRNAVADANAVAIQLRKRGFQVFEGQNLDRSAMNQLFNRFEASIAEGSVAIMYYAGHGVQVAGANVLLPVDLRAEGERDLLDDGIILAHLMDRMSAVNGRRSAGLNLLIVDACRDNPFKAVGRSVGIPRGLAAAGSSGVMVLYAAGSNQRALDRLGLTDADPNGLFTRVLLREMQTPGLPVRELVSRVRGQVAAAASSIGHEQVPAIYDEAVGDFTFTPAPAPAPAAQPIAAVPNVPPVQAGMADREALFWQAILNSTNPADYQAYLSAYPDGAFAPIARNRLAAALPTLPIQKSPSRLEALDTWEARMAGRRGLKELGYYAGRYGPEPLDDETREAIRRFQARKGASETGNLTTEQQENLEAAGQSLPPLLERPSHSPNGTAASAIRDAAARYARAWAADNPPRGGPVRNPFEAAYWYALAARDGDPRAYTQLGVLLARGQGVAAPNPAGAALLWHAAAIRGEAVAAFNLGTLHERGLGVPENRLAARLWYDMAASRGNAGAAAALRRLGP